MCKLFLMYVGLAKIKSQLWVRRFLLKLFGKANQSSTLGKNNSYVQTQEHKYLH